MSFDGQVDCQRMLIGPWALTIVGKPSVAAPAVAAAAPVKNLRREAVSNFLDCSLLIRSSFGLGKTWIVVAALLFLFPGIFCGKRLARPSCSPPGLWGLRTPKPANRIPIPTQNQAASRGLRIVKSATGSLLSPCRRSAPA